MYSMTAFGSAHVTASNGTVTAEYRSINNRFLECSVRLPEELRGLETVLRAQLAQTLKRGKVDLRVHCAPVQETSHRALDLATLRHIATQLTLARSVLPETPVPGLPELLHFSADHGQTAGETRRLSLEIWEPLVLQANTQALQTLQQGRAREGQRLAQAMLAQAKQIAQLVESVAAEQPALLAEHQEKITRKLRDALSAISPEGYVHISGAELSARIAQESLLFSLRVDIAEELTRLRSHGQELCAILTGDDKTRPTKGSTGKRLDFLFQEMQREANTLGSKSASVLVTRAAIDLKLLIEQLREQAQNIE